MILLKNTALPLLKIIFVLWSMVIIRPSMADTSLTETLEDLAEHSFYTESTVGIHVINATTKEEVFSHNADQHLIPASVMKALTSAAALKELGSEYRFVTEIRYTGELTDEGVLRGNLYVIGGGNPYMSGESVWKLVRDCKVAGVKSIQGGIYFDDTRYGGASYIPGWGKEVDLANGPSYFPMRSALSFNTNNVSIHVRPGKRIGSAAKIQLEYPFSIVEIDNKVKTSGAGGRSWMSLEREVIYEDDSIDVVQGEIKKVEKIIYHLTGRIPVNTTKTWKYYRSILQPEQFFQENFIEMLKQHGIGHRGKTGFRAAPEQTAPLVAQVSDPLRVLIGDMNKYSRNLTAESLILEMAAQIEQPASTENGIGQIENYLRDLGVWTDGTILHNGSGLSPTMQLQASQAAAVFLDMYDDPLLGPEYYTSLSVGGRDGTLRRRFQEEEYVAKARGKTGSINGVYCVATYVIAGDGDVYVFVYFANKLRRRSSFVRNLQNEMIQEIMDYTGQ